MLSIVRRSFANCAVEVVRFRWSNCTVVALYKSPKSTCPLWQLLHLLGQALAGTDQQNILIVGDFNVNMAKCDAAECRELVQWMAARGFIHQNVGSTTDLVSQIDQIWANFQLGHPTQTLNCYYSDHKQLLVCLPSSSTAAEQ